MSQPFPSDLHKQTINIIKKNNGYGTSDGPITSVLKHDVLTEELGNAYSRNTGVVYKNDRSVFDFANLAEKLIQQSKQGYYDFYKPDLEITSSYVQTVDGDDANIAVIDVFQKLRGCLDTYRVAFVDELNKVALTISGNAYDSKYLKENLPTPTQYVNMTNATDVKNMIDALTTWKTRIISILAPSAPPVSTLGSTMPTSPFSGPVSGPVSGPAPASASPFSAPAPAPTTNSLSDLKYDHNGDAINKDDFTQWTGKEISILGAENNHENCIYVIGQVFNIINPDYRKSFLPEDSLYSKILSKISSSISSVSAPSPTDIFTKISNIPPTGIANRIDGPGGNWYYVGGIETSTSNSNRELKNGKGMIRWKNGNIFEGTFANDVMQSGNFIESGKPSAKLVITITGAATGIALDKIPATLGSKSGTFDMDKGTFTQNP
jgi:hypothetical protein